MAAAIDVAREFLLLAADEFEPEPLTHMRLQKLLYYAQGLSLAYRGHSLFAEDLQAWKHGPVVPEIYSEFERFGGDQITLGAPHKSSLSDDDREFVASVWEGYRQYSAFALRHMTHSEPPWLDTRRGLPPETASQRTIPEDSIRRFFTGMCENELRAKSGIGMKAFASAEEDARKGRTISWRDARENLVKSS